MLLKHKHEWIPLIHSFSVFILSEILSHVSNVQHVAITETLDLFMQT